MKCFNNLVAGSAFAACSEALAVGSRFGLDPNVMFDVMNESTTRCSNTELVMRQQVVSGADASGLAPGLLAKDVAFRPSRTSPLPAALDVDRHADPAAVGRVARPAEAQPRQELVLVPGAEPGAPVARR